MISRRKLSLQAEHFTALRKGEGIHLEGTVHKAHHQVELLMLQDRLVAGHVVLELVRQRQACGLALEGTQHGRHRLAGRSSELSEKTTQSLQAPRPAVRGSATLTDHSQSHFAARERESQDFLLTSKAFARDDSRTSCYFPENNSLERLVHTLATAYDRVHTGWKTAIFSKKKKKCDSGFYGVYSL